LLYQISDSDKFSTGSWKPVVFFLLDLYSDIAITVMTSAVDPDSDPVGSVFESESETNLFSKNQSYI
jgi:hypothetical protein